MIMHFDGELLSEIEAPPWITKGNEEDLLAVDILKKEGYRLLWCYGKNGGSQVTGWRHQREQHKFVILLDEIDETFILMDYAMHLWKLRSMIAPVISLVLMQTLTKSLGSISDHLYQIELSIP